MSGIPIDSYKVNELQIGIPWDVSTPPVIPDLATEQVVATARSGVVQISQGVKGDAEKGSGFFIDKDGDVATAAHGILPQTGITAELTVTTDSGKSYPAHIEKLDLNHDLAIIGIDGPTPPDAHPLTLGDKASKPDQPMWALGHPQGEKPLYVSPGRNSGAIETYGDADREEYDGTFGASPCSEKAFKDFASKPDSHTYATGNLLLAHMHVEPGNSGGPIVTVENSQDEVMVAGLVDIGEADISYTAGITPTPYLKDLMVAKPSYTFSYKPDPTKPGYKILTGIYRADGTPVDDLSGQPAFTFMFRACQTQ